MDPSGAAFGSWRTASGMPNVLPVDRSPSSRGSNKTKSLPKTGEDDPYEEIVNVEYVAEEFHCPACGLHLDTRDPIEAVDLDVEHTETESRQREYDPDYGND
jgi:hypothetical protein